MAKIYKDELRKMVSEKIYHKYPKEEIYDIMIGTFACFEDILRNGDSLCILNCFTMEPKLRKGQKYKPFFGKEMTTQTHYIPFFKPSKALKNACLTLPVEEENIEKVEDDKDE